MFWRSTAFSTSWITGYSSIASWARKLLGSTSSSHRAVRTSMQPSCHTASPRSHAKEIHDVCWTAGCWDWPLCRCWWVWGAVNAESKQGHLSDMWYSEQGYLALSFISNYSNLMTCQMKVVGCLIACGKLNCIIYRELSNDVCRSQQTYGCCAMTENLP